MLNEKATLQNRLNSLMDVGIYQIMVINEKGRAKDWISPNKLGISPSKQDVFFMSMRLHQILTQDFDEDLGPSTCIVIERQDVKLVSVPFYSYSILVVMRKEIDHDFLVERITEIKNHYNDKLLEQEYSCMEVLVSYG